MSLLDEAKTLEALPLFSRVDPKKLKLLVLASERLTYRKDQVLCYQGDLGHDAFVILDGAAEVCLETQEGSIRVAEIGGHDIVGEMAILSNQPRSATVRVTSDRLDALKISKDDFLALMRDFPDVALEVTRHLADRLVKTTQELASLREKSSP